MNITYIHHSCFLAETQGCYYLFDYYQGELPPMDAAKPVFVLASHGHHDHYNPEILSILDKTGMQAVYAVLSNDIVPPASINVLQVAAGREYTLALGQKLTTFRSTDLGVAFLIEEGDTLLYHAGDLNDWVWEEETAEYNRQMTADYHHQIRLLGETLGNRTLDAAFVVLDPRQEGDYHRGMCHFLENISAKQVFPMHYWDQPEIIGTFLREYPQYQSQIQNTESYKKG